MCGCVIGACMGAFDAHQNFAAQLPDSFFQKEKRSMSDGLSEKDEERRGLMAGDDDDDDDDLYSLDADDLVDDVYSLGDEDLGQV